MPKSSSGLSDLPDDASLRSMTPDEEDLVVGPVAGIVLGQEDMRQMRLGLRTRQGTQTDMEIDIGPSSSSQTQLPETSIRPQRRSSRRVISAEDALDESSPHSNDHVTHEPDISESPARERPKGRKASSGVKYGDQDYADFVEIKPSVRSARKAISERDVFLPLYEKPTYDKLMVKPFPYPLHRAHEGVQTCPRLNRAQQRQEKKKWQADASLTPPWQLMRDLTWHPDCLFTNRKDHGMQHDTECSLSIESEAYSFERVYGLIGR